MINPVFTFHDHFFKIRRPTGDGWVVEDEYGTQAEVEDPENLRELREACGSILQGYREEMSMPGATS